MGNWETCRLLMKTASERLLFRRSAKPIVTICFDCAADRFLAISALVDKSNLGVHYEEGAHMTTKFGAAAP
jgi:hypothetical protein